MAGQTGSEGVCIGGLGTYPLVLQSPRPSLVHKAERHVGGGALRNPLKAPVLVIAPTDAVAEPEAASERPWWRFWRKPPGCLKNKGGHPGATVGEGAAL
jgi:hypothetical protein